MQNEVLVPFRARGFSAVTRCAVGLSLLVGFFIGKGATAQNNFECPSGKAAKIAKPVQAAHTPTVGSSERKAILDALRVDVQDAFKMRVRFVISDPERHFRVTGDWAFVDARYVQPDGSPMGKSYYAIVGDMSNEVQALLHRVKGKWQVVTSVVAVTDVEWEEWPKKYHAPAVVIPPSNG